MSAPASRSSRSGTHAPLDDEALRSLVGVDGLEVRNHEWWDDAAFAHVGELERRDGSPALRSGRSTRASRCGSTGSSSTAT